MNREELEAYIVQTYCAEAEFPWARYPNYKVYRHGGNRKWFAVVMDVPGEKLGLQTKASVDIVNVKCDPLMVGSFREEPGFLPAYHMSKENWISALLDGSADGETIKLLLEMSYRLTAPKARGRAKSALCE